MALIARKAILLAKGEATYGTDSVPTGVSNAIETTNLQITPLAGPVVSRNIDRPYLGGNLQIQVGTFVEVTFEFSAAGAGTSAVTIPKFGPLLKAVGFMTETVGIVDVQYILTSAITGANSSLSMYFHADGQKHAILGARGDLTAINITPGQLPSFVCRFVGLYVTPTSTADPTPTYTGWQVPKPVNKVNTVTASLHSVALGMISFTAQLGNDVRYRNVVGTESVEIVDRNPTARIVFEAPAIGTKDWFTTANNSTTGALQIVHGLVAANIIQLDAPNVQLVSPTYGESDGIRTIETTLSFVPGSSGNDEIKLSTK